MPKGGCESFTNYGSIRNASVRRKKKKTKIVCIFYQKRQLKLSIDFTHVFTQKIVIYKKEQTTSESLNWEQLSDNSRLERENRNGQNLNTYLKNFLCLKVPKPAWPKIFPKGKPLKLKEWFCFDKSLNMAATLLSARLAKNKRLTRKNSGYQSSASQIV